MKVPRPPVKMQKFQVTFTGYEEWVEIEAQSPEYAGEAYVEDRWDRDVGTVELDVRDSDGNLYEVTVDVDVQVSYWGMARLRQPEPTSGAV